MSLHDAADVETQVALLIPAVERQTEEVRNLTVELRRTNDMVQAQATKAAVSDDRLNRIMDEIWTADNSSRIRTLELHLKGIYAAVGFIAAAFGAQLIALLTGWIKFAVGARH